MAQFTNRATLRIGDTQINSNVAVGEIVEVLTASKTAVVDTYGRFDSISYVVSIINSGENAVTGINVVDNLGEYTDGENTFVPLDYLEGSLLYYVNGVLQPDPAVSATSPLTITGLSLPAGSNALIIYNVRAGEFAPLDVGASITNRVTVEGGGIATPIIAEETVTARSEPELSITKSISPIPVSDNGRLTYTFTIQNSGNTPAVATDDIVLTDLFDPLLTNLAVSYNGVVWAEGVNYTYDEQSGLFETAASQITVPAASYTRDPDTGAVILTPGVSVLTVTGTV